MSAPLLMTPREQQTAAAWIAAARSDQPPFAFTLDGKPSGEILPAWTENRQSVAQADGTTLHTVKRRDEQTGLECIIELTEYPGSPAAEWVLRFRNAGPVDSPILGDVHALQLARPCEKQAAVRVHYSKGTGGAIDDFALQQQTLHRGGEVRLASKWTSSRPYLPFFNLELAGEGVIVAIGWTGNWVCGFIRDSEGGVTVRAGMAKTRLRLRPGEEIRTPRILVLFWKDDIIRAHNMLRRHLVAHHLPRPGGKDIEAPICNATWGGMKTHNHLKTIQYTKDNGLAFDCYWIDAGWYGPDHQTEEFQNFYTEDWAYHIGHWRVNRMVHPDGLRPVVEAAHQAGMKVLLWFSPYTAEASSPLPSQHPEWLRRASGWGKGIGLNPRPAHHCIVKIGIPEARAFLLDYISDLIRQHKVDWFRDDGGVPLGPGDIDEPDREGIAEIRCVEGFYAFWDELRRRFPNLLIDNCGGGGSRIDLETIGRSLVFWRSDYNCDPAADPIGAQVGAHGLAHWVPMVGGAAPARPGDTYNFRSSFSGAIPFSLFHACGFGKATIGPPPDYPVEWHRRMIDEYRRARPYLKGDFYPLTSCSTSPMDWMAYQLDRPDLGGGIVLVFRRPKSPFDSAHFRLGGLDPSATYTVEDVDARTTTSIDGQSLAETGLAVTIPRVPDSRLLFYRKESL